MSTCVHVSKSVQQLQLPPPLFKRRFFHTLSSMLQPFQEAIDDIFESEMAGIWVRQHRICSTYLGSQQRKYTWRVGEEFCQLFRCGQYNFGTHI